MKILSRSQQHEPQYLLIRPGHAAGAEGAYAADGLLCVGGHYAVAAGVLTTEEAISSRLPPRSQVAAAATPLEALVAPQ